MRSFRIPLALAAFMAAAPAAHAATASGQLTVQATVVDTCAVANATLDFGPVNPGTGSAGPTTGAINVTCSLGTPFSVGLDNGANLSGGKRRMRRGATTDYLNYELYKDVTLLNRLGDTGSSDRVTGLTGLGLTANSVPLYGAVESGQSAGGGSYSDTVQIIVRF